MYYNQDRTIIEEQQKQFRIVFNSLCICFFTKDLEIFGNLTLSGCIDILL